MLDTDRLLKWLILKRPDLGTSLTNRKNLQDLSQEVAEGINSYQFDPIG